jgi:hypothetical protein
MISNYANQKELMQARIDIKTCETMLENIIINGTSCSPFESEIIVDKAKEVFCIGEYAETRTMNPGQIIWLAVTASEGPGKEIAKCKMKRVTLTFMDIKEDEEVYREYGLGARRQAQILRMTTEAMEQGAYLTQEDLSRILGSDVKTIRNDIKKLKLVGTIVPTRGQQKDIGPGITHREKAVKLFLEGKEPLEIGRAIKHTLRAVERYVDTFCRVVFCHEKMKNNLQTAMIVGVSTSLVEKYLDINDEYSKKDEYKERLESIKLRGKAYWDNIDFKKNASPSTRRGK